MNRNIMPSKKLNITAIIITLLFATQNTVFANLKELKHEKLQKQNPKLSCSSVYDYRLSAININWWDNFTDEYLKDYIYTAIEKNHNLKKAALRTQEYRENIKLQMSHELPGLMLSPTFGRIKTSQNQIFDIQASEIRTNLYAIPLFASYEADIFLKNHDKTNSAKKEYEAQDYEEKAAAIAIAVDVASLYTNIIKLDKIIKTQEKINNIREEIWKLTKERHAAGLASVYDVTYSDRLHTQSQIELNDLKRQRSLLLNELAVYIDKAPCESASLKRGSFDKLEYKGKIPKCISSEVVSLRPDIMKAEANLQKAKIDVRIARKDFLPSIMIVGSTGYNSLLLEDLFNWENVFGLAAISAMQKLFTGGHLTANLRMKKLKYEQLFEEYKQADLTALQEINDAMCLIKYDTTKDNDNLKKVKLEQKNFSLVQERHREGIISYLEMIQFQETLLSLQTEKDNSKAQRLIDYMTLYKATGTKFQ